MPLGLCQPKEGDVGVKVNLVFIKSDGTRRDIPLKPGKYVVGRSDQAQLRIPMGNVSRKHCQLVVEENSVRVRDLDSSNGTFVNYNQVQESELGPGDVLGIGSVQLIVQIDGQPAKIVAPKTLEEALDETPPSGVETPVKKAPPPPSRSAEYTDDPDRTVTRAPGVRGPGAKAPNEDSSIFDFDFDFENDENPKL